MIKNFFSSRILYLYGDLQSQPTRALWVLAMENEAKIGKWKRVDVNLSKFDQYKPEFKKIWQCLAN